MKSEDEPSCSCISLDVNTYASPSQRDCHDVVRPILTPNILVRRSIAFVGNAASITVQTPPRTAMRK